MTKDTPIVETEWKEETPTVETEWTDVEVVKKKDNADSKLEIGSKVSTSSVGQSKSTSESSTVNKPTYDVSKLTNIPGLNTQKTQQLDLTRPAQKKTISQKEPLLKPTQKELVTGDYIIKDDRPKNIEKIQSALGKGTPVVEQKQTIKVEENPYKVDITDKSSENTSTKNQVAKRSILEDATALNTLSSDELINVDETTANDFLVSSGVKNKDREQYISEQAQSNPKYGYDYEYNKIGSLYKAVKQRADDYDVVLKEKFGDNYFELAKQGDVNVVNDEDFNKFAQLREKQNQLSTKANGLINEDKYKEVKDYNIQKEKKQAEADAIAKKDTWYNPKDELKYIDSKVAQTLGKVVKMVAEIPALATSIDKGYDWTDKLADWGDRYANAVIDDVPVSSDFKGSFSNDVANVDGYKVIVDENKNVIDVRDKNNFKVPASVSQPLIEKYSANPANYKIKNEKSYRSLVDNGLNTVLDMGVMILGTKGAGMLGAAEKLQKLTSIGIAYQQTKRDVFNDAIKKGLDPRKADELSNIIAIAAGTSNLINPMEYNIASGKGLFSFIKKEGLDASKIALINEGKLGIKDYAKQFVKSGLKNTVGENIEELGIENTTQAIANNAFNKSISAEDRTDGGLDDKLHIFDKQGLETFLITSGAAMLMTPIEMKSQTTFNQQEALKMAMEKPDDFAKIRQMQVANGTITPQQFESEKKILEEVSQTYNASKDDIKEELQPQLIALLVKKYNLTNKINEIKDEALASPYKVILEKVNAGIQDIAGGKSASPELVETVEENINPATGMVVEQTDTKVPVVNTTIGTATAKDGSDIITQTKVAISNKNAKGEPLTGEEQDFYNNYKEEIDGLASKVESSNEVKITDEKYKDIPSQKIEYKDGTAFVHKDKEGNKEHLFISRMDVSNKGKGTGSEMLKKVEEHALKIELDQVVTIPETDASRKFFEKNGYTYSDGILTKDLKQKTNKDETKITPIKPVEQGQQNNDGTGLSETAKEEVEGVSGSALKDVESTAKALDEAEKNSPITIEQTEFGGKVSGGIIDVKIKAIKGDKKENVKTPSTLNFLPRVLELVHLARNKKDKAKIISGKFDSNNVSIDSPIPGIYFSSEDWSTMDRFGRSKEDSIYTTIDNDGLLYFDSAKGLRSFLKENNLPSEGQTLNASQVATLKNMGVKGILLREDFASQSRNELIVIDESIIKSVSEKPISGVTKLPPSFSNTKDISEAYHKAKADGSNPELVKAVEDLLGKAPTQYTEAATPKDDSAIQSGGEQKLPDQKEVQVTAEEKINPLESKFKKKIPTEKVEETVDEIVTPIRQLGTGANVYFETPKYRVNETKDGKVLLNINGEEDGGMAIANIEFDNVNEAVKVAERLQQDFPNGIPDDIRAEKYVEATREDLNKENINATPEVSKPVSEVADNTEQQGVKEAVSKSVDATGQGNAEVAVADVKTPISKTETTEKQNKVVASDNTKNKKKDYEMSSSEYEKERQISVPVFKRAKIIAIRILDWSGTGGLYEKYINSKGIKPNINGVYENTDISNIEDYMKFLLKEKADFFTREDYETYLKYKDFMDRGIDPDWNNHETRVSSALYENKEVPKSVLSEYPNLENKESGIAEITPNKNVSASKASAIKDLLADKYSDLKEMEAGVLANLDGTESIDDLMEYVDWNRTTQKGGVYKGKGLKGSNIVKLIEKGYVEELSFMDENITLTDKGKKFQEALKARQETRKGIKEGTDLFPKDAGLSGKELIGDALDRIVDKIGGKKNLTEQEKTTLTKDITDLAKGLLQEGKATIDNIIDKIIDAIKKRLPDLDEKDVKDLADTVNDKVIFSEGVKWYKDNGYTYEQTKKRLDEINADYTEQELKDAWDGEKKEKLDDSKQRVADRFVKGNNSFEDAKNMVIENGYDKGDYDSKQIIKDIDNLIKKTGIENIEQLLDLPLSEPHRVVLQSKLIEHFGNQSTDESLSAEQREEAFEKSARYLLDLSRERTDSGRGNAILNQIYMDTDIYFTLPMMMKKMDALGTILSDTEMAEIKEMAKEIEQLREENKKLQELAKKEEEQNIIDDITTHLLVDELIIDSKTKEDEEIKKAKNVLAKGFQDIARMLGGIKMVTQEEKVKFTETILDMTKATMTISKIGVKRALKAVIKSIRSANPNIDENLIKDAEQHVLNNIKETDTGIKKKDGTGISKDELLALVEGGADTMDKLIVAIRDKYHDGDKNVTDKQIRDEITNYGKSTRESRTDIEKKLTEIKSVMLLQSKLEDAENNIAPKKTGLIRDKATMPVREKRRELAEAMKKLTVTLTEDDIAGLNERKLTQLANRIEEVQNVLKGIQKPNKQGVFEYSDEVKKKQKELDDLMNDQKVLLHYAKEKLNNLLAKYQDRLDKKQYAKNPTINKLTLTDKEYVDLKAKLEAKKEELKKKRNDFRNNDADYLLNTKQKQIDRQIAELDNLLSGINQRKTSEQLKAERDRKAGIINTSTNTTALQKLKDNQAKLEAKKEEWEKKVIQKEIEEEKKKRTWLDKLGVFYEEVKATSRLATLGLIDIGWVGVQGGYFLRTKPITTLKSLKNAWDSGGLSEKEFDAWRKELKNNPFYETMLKAGLDIPNQSLRQDLWQQEFRPSTVSNFLDKVPILNIPNKNGRLSLKFLTNLRIKAFNDLYNGLTATQKTDPEILEKLADFVNSRSGAGRVIGEDKNRGLNKHWNFMTSVRNTSSMLQQTYIGMLYGLYKNYDSKSGFSINPKTAMAKQPIVYRQITHDLQNQIVLWGTVYLAYLLANINDKDKEDDWNVELSPFSTDFGKLKNKSGNRSYFDIGGTTALNVASLRLLFTVTNGLGLSDVQNYKNYKGEYSQLNAQGWGGKKGIDIAASAFLNRTLSFYSPIKTPLIAEKNKDGNYNIFGQNYTPSEYKWKIIKDMVFPMNIPAVWNDYKDKDVNAGINVLDFILSGTGISYNNQIYDSKQPSQNTQKAPSVNSLGAPLQKPKKKESIFKNMFNKNP